MEPLSLLCFQLVFLVKFYLIPLYIEVKDIGSITPKILVTNDGSQPAHNLSLFLRTSNNKIINITNDFSTTDVILMKPKSVTLERGITQNVNDSSLEIFIPRLSSGLGSIVEMKTSLNNSDGDYLLQGVYDQGSATATNAPNILRNISMYSFIFLPLFVTYSAVAIVSFFLAFWIRKRRRVQLIKVLVFNIIKWHREIEDDPVTNQEINLYQTKLDKKIEKANLTFAQKYPWERELWNRRHADILNIIKNPKDYVIIDDLYSKLNKRNEKIKTLEPKKNPSPEIYQYEVEKINDECLRQLNEAMNIEWENYY